MLNLIGTFIEEFGEFFFRNLARPWDFVITLILGATIQFIATVIL
jgi:hypothetical protein